MSECVSMCVLGKNHMQTANNDLLYNYNRISYYSIMRPCWITSQINICIKLHCVLHTRLGKMIPQTWNVNKKGSIDPIQNIILL